MTVPTPWHTIGPFFPQTFFREGDNDLRRITPDTPAGRGEPLWLGGRVLQADGGPAVNAVIEAWQADAGGLFRHPLDPGWRQADPNFCGWGRAWTDAAGAYEFLTVLPGGYDDAAGRRAPHIDLALLGSGIMRRLLTTVFFPEQPDNGRDPVLACVPPERRHLLIAAEAGEDAHGVRRLRFDIRLRGEAETPFFLD